MDRKSKDGEEDYYQPDHDHHPAEDAVRDAAAQDDGVVGVQGDGEHKKGARDVAEVEH